MGRCSPLEPTPSHRPLPRCLALTPDHHAMFSHPRVLPGASIAKATMKATKTTVCAEEAASGRAEVSLRPTGAFSTSCLHRSCRRHEHSRPTGAFSTSFPRHADDTPTQAPTCRNSPTSTPVWSPSGRAQPSGWSLATEPRESVPPHCPGPAATNVPRPTTQVFCEPGSWLTEIVSMGQTSLSGAPLRRG